MTNGSAKLLFDRFDRAAAGAGIPNRLGVLDENTRNTIAERLEKEARAMLNEKHAGYPESFENKTIIIECARGGPGGAAMVDDPAAFRWQSPDWRGRPWAETVISYRIENRVGSPATAGFSRYTVRCRVSSGAMRCAAGSLSRNASASCWPGMTRG